MQWMQTVYVTVAAKNFPGENQCLLDIKPAVRRQLTSCVFRPADVLGRDGVNVHGCLSGGDGVRLRPKPDPRENEGEERGERGKNLNSGPRSLLSLSFFN